MGDEYTVDGEYQNFKAKGEYTLESIFWKTP